MAMTIRAATPAAALAKEMAASGAPPGEPTRYQRVQGREWVHCEQR
jgi:hypothetical protein